MQSYSGADIIITLLERQGIKTIAGIPGGANLPIYDALARNGRIRHVLARHEQGAGFIAQGMTRVSGEVQVCFATSGPGATNILTAIADARLDSIPIVCITGQVPSSLIGTDAFQEVDTYGLSIPITKHNFLVRNVSELLTVIPEAFRIAASGRPGPVLIDVPKDVQQGCIEIETWPEPGRPDPTPEADRAALIKAASMINAAQRPVFYIGGGIVASGASKALLALCEKGSIPVTPTLMGLDAIPADHPLNIGMLGMHAARYTNQALHACDLLVAVGSRFDDRATGRVESFCSTARIIHVDIDPSEIDKIKPSSIGITGDARQVLEAWLPEIRATDRSEWTGEIERLKQAFPMEFPGADDPMTAYGVIRKTAGLLPPDAIITTDVGQHQMKVAQAYPFSTPRTWLTSGGLGTMGFGFPTAIGAALQAPDRPVVCFSGDGSFLMNIQELATLAEENLNLKIVLLDNQSLGLVHQQQHLFYEARFIAVNYPRKVDFVAIAKGFGVPAISLGDTDDPSSALAGAFSEPGPCLIHVPTDVYDQVFPMVPPGGCNTEMLTHSTTR